MPEDTLLSATDTVSVDNDTEKLLDELQEKSSRMGIALASEQRDAVKALCSGVIEYSQHTNLVGKSEFSVLVREHVLDSLSLVPFMTERVRAKAGKLIDIGSGAGFPAIVLCIALPGLKATLVEASGKKCRFLSEIVRTLNMSERVRICSERAEEYGHNPAHRGSYDWGTARAVGTFDLSAELVMPFLAVGGLFFSQKSSAQKDEELNRAELCLPKLGGTISQVRDLDEAILGKSRVLLIAEKIVKTPTSYPRAWTKIKSHPLGA